MLEQKEAAANIKLDSSKPYVVRLDGSKFGKFTEPFKKPYDNRCMFYYFFYVLYFIGKQYLIVIINYYYC